LGVGKKERTIFRFIKPGDIFCFKCNEQMYCFGRILILALTLSGHLVEIFDYTSTNAVIGQEDIENASRMVELVVVSSYILFDQKLHGGWRIIGYQEDYNPKELENIYFTYSAGCTYEKLNIYGNKTPIDEEERCKYIALDQRANIDMEVSEYLGVEYKVDNQWEMHKALEDDTEENGINKNDYISFFKDDESIEICIDVGDEKVMEVGEKISVGNEDAYMNGYNWDALFSCYLKKHEPDILKEMETDPEADMYAAFYPLTPENESRAERFVEIIRSLIEQDEKLCQFVKEEGDEIEWD